MVGRMGGGLYFLVEIELKMSKIPPITNPKKLVTTFIGFGLKKSNQGPQWNPVGSCPPVDIK